MIVVRWCVRFAWLLVFVVMLGLNVATLTVSSVATLANSALSTVGASTVAARSATRAAAAAAPAREVAQRMSRRVVTGAKRSLGATIGQSVPFLGIAAVVGVTAWEINDACAMLEDLESLEASLDELESGAVSGLADVDAKREQVCGMEVPTVPEVRERALEAPSKALKEMERWLGTEPSADDAPLGDD